MAKASKKSRSSKKNGAKAKKTEAPEVRHEVWGLVFLVLSVILLISLVTYKPTDPALTDQGRKAANWIGRLGAMIASGALQSFGYSAYLAVVATGAFGAILGMRRAVSIKVKEAAGSLLAVVFFSILLDLFLSAEGRPYSPGGMVGGLVNRLLIPYLGEVGLGLLCGLGLAISLVMATNAPPLQTAWKVVSATARWLWRVVLASGRLAKSAAKKLAGLGASLIEAGKRAIADFSKKRHDKAMQKAASRLQKKAEAEADDQSAKVPAIAGEDKATKKEEEKGRPPLLDRGQKDVVISVKRTGDRPIEAQKENQRSGKKPESEPIKEEIERPVVLQPSRPFVNDEQAEGPTNGEAPQIVDRRPRRASAEEIDGQSLEAQEEIEAAYELPPLAMLDYAAEPASEIDREQLYANARLLEQTLLDYKIEGKVKEIHPGPVVTMYEFAPARGTKLSRITNLEDDLAMAMAALKVRIVAPIPGKSVVGIEVPSKTRETVYLKEIIGHRRFTRSKSPLTVAIGKDIFGHPMVADLAKMPHLLIAGATGAGKSVGVNSMIVSILYRNTPEDVRFILIDPKRLEFSFYEGIPHLLLPVMTDPKQASLALGWVVHEMDTRYQTMSEWGVKNIDSYNRLVRRLKDARALRGGDIESVIEDFSSSEGGDLRLIARKLKTSPPPDRMPLIVVVIDELADLMMVSGKEVELSIARLAQLARASGIHLIVATQRPSTDVLTGLIKNNLPARISFRVAQKVDSRVILDRNGAESLLGRGDMLFVPGGGDLLRVHGAFISEQETIRVVDFIKKQRKATYQHDILDRIEQQAEQAKVSDQNFDSEYDHAVALVCDSGKASISMVQRKLRVGYNRAARMIEHMEEEGIVGPPDGSRGRPVYGRPAPRD